MIRRQRNHPLSSPKSCAWVLDDMSFEALRAAFADLRRQLCATCCVFRRATTKFDFRLNPSGRPGLAEERSSLPLPGLMEEREARAATSTAMALDFQALKT